MLKPFLQVVDAFYLRPDKIRLRAVAMDYFEPERFTGWRTQAYQPRGIKKLIETRFRIKIDYWEDDLNAIEASNGVFFSAFANGSRAELVGVHFDEPLTWTTLVVYLTPDAPCDAGTSLWQHRETGLISKPTRRDALRLGTTFEKLITIVERDRTILNRWVEIDRIGNVYNRAVIFRGGFFHSATRHFGNNRYNGRLYQSFHFPIKSDGKKRLMRSGRK
jgi:hypothetical protein